MNQAIKLIYVGILKFGFKDSGGMSIVGLVDYMLKNNLALDEEPTISINRTYTSNSGEYFWELEWHNDNIKDQRYLVVYFDQYGCHFQRFFDQSRSPGGLIEGDLMQYSEFMEQYRWLADA